VNFSHRIYGFSISSQLSIPGLTRSAEPLRQPDIRIQFGAEPQWVKEALQLSGVVVYTLPPSADTLDPGFAFTSFGGGQIVRLAYSDGTTFVVDSAATRVWGAIGHRQTIEDLATYLLGPIMGYILRKRGVTALHASAVCLDGKALALIGEAGAGKSTSAAALALRGLPVLCEDIAALRETASGFHVCPGHPRVCLWPESVQMLMGQSDALPLITPNWDKRYLPLDQPFAQHETRECPLGAIYILAPREVHHAPRIEEVSSRDVLLELVQNTYMNWLLDRSQRAEEFELLSRLISQVPIRRIIPHRDPAQLGSFCDLLLADAARILSGRIAMPASAAR
jgi:hypothetical protein